MSKNKKMKYILSKTFVKNTSMCGVPFVARKQKGNVVEGLLMGNGQNLIVKFDCPNSNQRIGVNIPTNILIEKKSSLDGSDNTTNTESTGNSKMVKNVIMGVVAVGVIYALYKIFNK
jgi:hypothetical protein